MTRYCVLIIVLIAFLNACSKEEEPAFEAFSSSEISGVALWQRISGDYPYSEYAFWPGHEGVRAGQAPHGSSHRIYVNRTLLEALPAADKTAPAGSIIVKDNLNASKELVSITAMAKVPGYNPEAGDWFWVSYRPDGTVRVEGKPRGCISCHEGLADNDYVIVQQLDRPLRTE